MKFIIVWFICQITLNNVLYLKDKEDLDKILANNFSIDQQIIFEIKNHFNSTHHVVCQNFNQFEEIPNPKFVEQDSDKENTLKDLQKLLKGVEIQFQNTDDIKKSQLEQMNTNKLQSNKVKINFGNFLTITDKENKEEFLYKNFNIQKKNKYLVEHNPNYIPIVAYYLSNFIIQNIQLQQEFQENDELLIYNRYNRQETLKVTIVQIIDHIIEVDKNIFDRVVSISKIEKQGQKKQDNNQIRLFKETDQQSFFDNLSNNVQRFVVVSYKNQYWICKKILRYQFIITKNIVSLDQTFNRTEEQILTITIQNGLDLQISSCDLIFKDFGLKFKNCQNEQIEYLEKNWHQIIIMNSIKNIIVLHRNYTLKEFILANQNFGNVVSKNKILIVIHCKDKKQNTNNKIQALPYWSEMKFVDQQVLSDPFFVGVVRKNKNLHLKFNSNNLTYFKLDFTDKQKNIIISFRIKQNKHFVQYRGNEIYLETQSYEEIVFLIENNIFLLCKINTIKIDPLIILKNQNIQNIKEVYIDQQKTKNTDIQFIQFSKDLRLNKHLSKYLKHTYNDVVKYKKIYLNKNCPKSQQILEYNFQCSNQFLKPFLIVENKKNKCKVDIFVKSFLVCGNQQEQFYIQEYKKQEFNKFCYFEIKQFNQNINIKIRANIIFYIDL